MTNKSKTRQDSNLAEIPQQQTAHFAAVLRQSPFPPPEELERFAKVYPEAPRIIFESFEKEGDHRRKLENKIVESRSKETTTGQWMGFVLALILICGGFYCIIHDKNVQGFGLIVVSVVSLAGVFVYGRKQKQENNKISSSKETEEK